MSAWNALNQQIIACERCPRLRSHCAETARRKRRAYADWTYWGRPVPNFGDPQASLLIVGLAPAAHGANRTGRMFTGDRSGDWLYRALHEAGWADRAESQSRDDGLKLSGCAITAVCHCAPPGNRPTRQEIAQCRPWLARTIDLTRPRLLLALGAVAWRAAVDEACARGWLRGPRPRYAHAAQVSLGGRRRLLASYHPSQQNTFTGRLTEPMWEAVFREARALTG